MNSPLGFFFSLSPFYHTQHSPKRSAWLSFLFVHYLRVFALLNFSISLVIFERSRVTPSIGLKGTSLRPSDQIFKRLIDDTTYLLMNCIPCIDPTEYTRLSASAYRAMHL